MPVRESKSGLRSPKESAVSMMPAVSEPKSGLASSREAASPPLCSRISFLVFQGCYGHSGVRIVRKSEPVQSSVWIGISADKGYEDPAQPQGCTAPMLRLKAWASFQIYALDMVFTGLCSEVSL